MMVTRTETARSKLLITIYVESIVSMGKTECYERIISVIIKKLWNKWDKSDGYKCTYTTCTDLL